MAEAQLSDTQAGTISIEKVSRLLTVVLRVPKAWGLAVGVGVLISLVQVTRLGTGGVVVVVGVTTITAIVASLLWLPALLAVVTLAGFGIKGLGGEASSPGVIELLKAMGPEQERTALAAVDAAVESSPRAAEPAAQALRQAIEERLGSIPATEKDARQHLRDLAKRYVAIRTTMQSSSQRTTLMTQISSEARSLARDANLSAQELKEQLHSRSEGDRVVALALVQQRPDPSLFDDVLALVSPSDSAFQQYRALVTIREMLPQLSGEQKRRLVEVLEHECSGQPGTWITRQDSSRWNLAQDLIRQAKTG